MLDWLRRRASTGTPLERPPRPTRVKTYSAESGYVYQHFLEGSRATPDGREYLFAVSSDRKNWLSTAVLLRDDVLDEWHRRNERDLTVAERYAIAKMALFRAFDAWPAPAQREARITPEVDEVDNILHTLGAV